MYEVFEDKKTGQFFVGLKEQRAGSGRRKIKKVGVMYTEKSFAEDFAAEMNHREPVSKEDSAEDKKQPEAGLALNLESGWQDVQVKQHDSPKPAEKKPDMVVRPNHYTWRGTEAKNLVQGFLGQEGIEHFWLGNALKYLYRYPMKNRAQDVRKAIQCLILLLADVFGEHWKLVREEEHAE